MWAANIEILVVHKDFVVLPSVEFSVTNMIMENEITVKHNIQ